MKFVCLTACLAVAAFTTPTLAQDYVITLKDHEFSPKELAVPAGQKIALKIKNQNTKPAEFESDDLNREKVIGPNSEVTVKIGPLEAGTYSYENEFDKTATGTLVAK